VSLFCFDVVCLSILLPTSLLPTFHSRHDVPLVLQENENN
jgi:hypothetical protein